MFSSDYVESGERVDFSIQGFTNPTTTAIQTFTIYSQWESDDSSIYNIDSDSSASLQAYAGVCNILDIYPTDENTMYMDEPANYTVQMYCNHDIDTTMGIQLQFPTSDTDWTIMDTSRCEAEFFIPRETDSNPRYRCNGYNETRTVEVFYFTEYGITAGITFSFTIGHAIINPASLEEVGQITVSTISEAGDILDSGTYQFEDNYFNTSLVETFEITPLNLGVGMFPVTY